MKWLLFHLSLSYLFHESSCNNKPVCVSLNNGPSNRSKEITECKLPANSVRLRLECKIISNYHTQPSESYTGIQVSFDVYDPNGSLSENATVFKFDTLNGHSKINESLFFEHENNLDAHLKKNASVRFTFNNNTKIHNSRLIIYNLIEVCLKS